MSIDPDGRAEIFRNAGGKFLLAKKGGSYYDSLLSDTRKLYPEIRRTCGRMLDLCG